MQWYNYIKVVERKTDSANPDSKTSTFFQFQNWEKEVYRTRAEVKAGKPAETKPVEMSKRTVSAALDSISGLTSGIRTENLDKLLRFCEKELVGGLSVYMKEAQEKEDSREVVINKTIITDETGAEVEVETVEDPIDSTVFRSFLIYLQETLDDMDFTSSTANPLREALAILAKSKSLDKIQEVYENIPATADSWKAAEETRIQAIYEKMQMVTKADLSAYVESKRGNGVDPKDGSVLLKAPKNV